MTNWKEQFDKNYTVGGLGRYIMNENPDWIKEFISTEIIEKLIEDIPEVPTHEIGGTKVPVFSIPWLKQQLREKWL